MKGVQIVTPSKNYKSSLIRVKAVQLTYLNVQSYVTVDGSFSDDFLDMVGLHQGMLFIIGCTEELLYALSISEKL